MVRLTLHIGMSKTGSTSIQAAFEEARLRLRAEGIDYLDLGRNHGRLIRVALRGRAERSRHPALAALGIARASADYDPGRVRAAIEAKFAAPRAPHVIVSGEGLYGLEPDEIAALGTLAARHFRDVQVVVYVREPVGWAASRLQEAVKHGRTIDEQVDGLARDPARSPLLPRFRRQVGAYRDVFGAERVSIRPFEPARFAGGDLIADFCTAIGRPELAGALGRTWNNPRLSWEALLLIEERYRQLRERAAGEHRGRRRHGGTDLVAEAAPLRRLLQDLPGTPFALPADVSREIRRFAADDVAWLREATGDPGLFAAPAVLVTPPAAPAWDAATLRALGAKLEAANRRPWLANAIARFRRLVRG